MIKNFIKELLKEIVTDPRVIREILDFIERLLLQKGNTRESVAGFSAATYNIPYDIALKMVDYVIEKIDKINKKKENKKKKIIDKGMLDFIEHLVLEDQYTREDLASFLEVACGMDNDVALNNIDYLIKKNKLLKNIKLDSLN